MSDVTSTSGRLHCEFVCILFFQTHRETDRFFDTSGVQIAKTKPRPVSFSNTVFYSQIKSKVDNILTKVVTLHINLNIDCPAIDSTSHM